MPYDQRRKELDQQIAELRAKIAAGAGDVGTASYILRGDTKLMDMASRAEQSAIDKAIQEAENEKQREFQRAQNQAARDNAMKIAEMSRSSAKSPEVNLDKLQVDADVAQAEYDEAVKKVDMNDPDSITRAKKAAIKLNYAQSLLPYFDKDVHIVPTEFNEDATEIAKGKTIKSAKARLDALTKVDSSKWTEKDKAAYTEDLERLKELDPDSVTKYEVDLRKKPLTVQQRIAKRKREIDSYDWSSTEPDGTVDKYGSAGRGLYDKKTGKLLRLKE